MKFEAFRMHPAILSEIKAAGYTTPTPIQSEAIPEILKGNDVMGLALTGTGKTAAFVLPMLDRMMAAMKAEAHGRRHIRSLIVAPTRELAEQINDSIRELGRGTPFRSMTIYGGASPISQLKRLRQGVDIVVACPGRLLDHINQGNVDLSRVEVLVLDEADRMLDMGFMPDIKRIVKHLPADRQTLLFSATMPDDIRQLTRQLMKNPTSVQVEHSMPAKTVSHALYPVAEHLKTNFLLTLLKNIDSQSVIVFTRTKHRARQVAEKLLKNGFRATPLQGNMTQGRRQESLSGFRSGKYKILVATDIAARGVDVSSISHVINFDMPDTVDAYTHRVGRTGRAARTGEAFTFVTGADNSTVKSFERFMGMKLMSRKLEGFDYNTPALGQKNRAAVPQRPAPVNAPAAPRRGGFSGRRPAQRNAVA